MLSDPSSSSFPAFFYFFVWSQPLDFSSSSPTAAVKMMTIEDTATEASQLEYEKDTSVALIDWAILPYFT